MGTYAVMVVKTNSKGYPKEEIKARMKTRGDIASYKTSVEGVNMWATGHMDKKPLTVVHTCDSIAPGKPRYRTFSKWSKDTHRIRRAVFKLDQPSVAATYRDKFWHVDRYNKLSLGPDSMQYAVRTQDWKVRFFLGLVGMSECNAYLAHRCVAEAASVRQDAMDRWQWKMTLAGVLVSDPFRGVYGVREAGLATEVAGQTMSSILGGHGYVLAAHKDARVCTVCTKYAAQQAGTSYKSRTTFACKCGARVCNPSATQRMCFMVHMLRECDGEQWETARRHV